MKKISLIVLFTLPLLACTTASAKRAAPKPVKNITFNNIEFSAPNSTAISGIGVVVATDQKSGNQLWWKQIYVIKYNPELERDVQDIFITNLKIKKNSLVIENERGYAYSLNLKSLTVKVLKGKPVIKFDLD